MHARILLLAAVMGMSLVAFDGAAPTLPEMAEPAAASCTDIGFGCTESQVCRALTDLTGHPWNCIE